jgi:hypothetical protein
MYNFSILRDLKKCYSKLTVVIKGKKNSNKNIGGMDTILPDVRKQLL